jgi:prepilin-type N-terminal cleavage/methylation domain-containing protein
MSERTARERGFTLAEVLVAAAVFVVVAAAGFESVRALGSTAALVAARASAASATSVAVERMRTDATSSLAVWVPASSCGPAVSMLRRDASGATYTTYVVRAGTLVRASGAGPLDPCAGEAADALLSGVGAFTATAVPANGWATHVDPVGGEADGGFFRPNVPAIAVDAHARDYDGTPIASGNGAVEVTLDADPFPVVADLVAGNRPTGFTETLTYACGARCDAASLFPEIASLDVGTCAALAPDLPDASTSYVAASTGLDGAGRIVTTSYALYLRYGFAFTGDGTAVTAERDGPLLTWPAVPSLADPYPVDYADNALRSFGAAALAATFGPPPNLARAFADCAGIDDETLFRG